MVAEIVLGKDNIGIGNWTNELVLIYYKLKKYMEAELLFRRSLAIYEKAGGRNHETAVAMVNLACVCRNKDRYEEAEILFNTALEIVETVVDAPASIRLSIYYQLATGYDNQKRYGDAETYYRRALEINTRNQDNGNMISTLLWSGRCL